MDLRLVVPSSDLLRVHSGASQGSRVSTRSAPRKHPLVRCSSSRAYPRKLPWNPTPERPQPERSSTEYSSASLQSYQPASQDNVTPQAPTSTNTKTTESTRPVFEPEVVDDHELRAPNGAAHRAEEPSTSEPPTADVAKLRWLSDRDASIVDDSEKKASLDWALLPGAGMNRVREKLAKRQKTVNGRSRREAELLYDSVPPFGYQALRKAQRKSSMSTEEETFLPLQGVPKSVLVLGLCIGCTAAAGIAYRARHQYPFGMAAVSTHTAGATSQVLGHVAVEEAPLDDLAPVLADGSVLLRTAAADAFLNMQADARRQGVYLLPLSGFRSVKDQQAVFYGVKAARNQNIRDRAKVSAPPGYSEHHTGYALDIGDASEPGAHLEFDFENTEAFQWLQANANRYHYELSFPPDNEQGIMYEPWHWRFVGNNHATLTFYGNILQTPRTPLR